MEHRREPHGQLPRKSKANIAFAGLFLVAATVLTTEYWTQLGGWVQYWPYLLLLACPLMHVFTHRAHGHAQRNHRPREASSEPGGEMRP